MSRNSILRIFFFFALTFGFSSCEQEKWGVSEDMDVAVLTDDNFDQFVDKHEWVFVKFYAPWCGHCKTMAPSYAELALENKYSDDGIPIAKLEGTIHKKIAQKFKVEGFPSLKLFNRGFPIDYKGGREKKDIQAFITTKLKVKPEKIDSLDEFEDFRSARLAAVYYMSSINPENLQNFKKFILQFNNIPLAYTDNPKIRDLMGGKGKFSLLVVRNFDDGNKHIDSDKPFSHIELSSEFKKVRFGFVMEFNDEALDRIDEEKKTAFYLFTEFKNGVAAELVRKIAPKYSEDFLFVIANVHDEAVKKIADFFKVKTNENVRLMGYKGGKNQKYKSADLSETSIVQLLNDFKENKARQYFASDPIPALNGEPVKVIVGANFANEIIKSDKHVLLEIYTPWCGHCKQLEPIYKSLANKLANYQDIVIAKMDGSSNEYPKVEASGYPTIFFFPKGKKDKPIKYEGDRTIQKFLVFLNRHIGRVHQPLEIDTEL